MTTTDFDELDGMKQQLRELQEKLKGRDIVNDRMIRNAFSSNIGRLMRRETLQLVMLLVMLIVYPPFFRTGGCSLGLTIYAEALFVVCALSLVWSMSQLEKIRRSMGDNIVDTNTRLLRLKRGEQRWLHYCAPVFITIFLGWFCHDIYYLKAFSFGELDMHGKYTLMGSMIVGALIGGIIGYFRFYRPKIDALNEALSQLEDLKENENI